MAENWPLNLRVCSRRIRGMQFCVVFKPTAPVTPTSAVQCGDEWHFRRLNPIQAIPPITMNAKPDDAETRIIRHFTKVWSTARAYANCRTPLARTPSLARCAKVRRDDRIPTPRVDRDLPYYLQTK